MVMFEDGIPVGPIVGERWYELKPADSPNFWVELTYSGSALPPYEEVVMNGATTEGSFPLLSAPLL